MKTRITRAYQCDGGAAAQRLAKQKALTTLATPKQLSQSVRYLYYAEQSARNAGCSTTLRPESVTPAKEVYSTVCRGEQIYITCNRSGCSSQ